jgi:hypothetical protein
MVLSGQIERQINPSMHSKIPEPLEQGVTNKLNYNLWSRTFCCFASNASMRRNASVRAMPQYGAMPKCGAMPQCGQCLSAAQCLSAGNASMQAMPQCGTMPQLTTPPHALYRGSPCKARNFNVVYTEWPKNLIQSLLFILHVKVCIHIFGPLYIWTYVWQRWNPSLSIFCAMFSTLNLCRKLSCGTVVCKHFASYQSYPNYRWDLIR